MNFTELIGRFHPLLVHLPIGFLLMGLILFWLSRFKILVAGNILALIFLLGSLSAVVSCITGYLLSQTGYDNRELVVNHRNAAIFFSILSITMWWLVKKEIQRNVQTILSILIFSMLVITGHQGGSLTHGSDYLFGKTDKEFVVMPIVNVDEAFVYSDIINPIFQQKCVGCHGPEKQKGKLRLDEEKYILKGGKTGQAVVAGSKDKSEMLERILLPPDDEDHMPPKEKGQLNANQKALIEWWIASGASFTAKVKETKQDSVIKPALAALSETQIETSVFTELPQVDEAPKNVIDRLQKWGVVVVPVSQNSNLLSVNLVNCTSLNDSLKMDISSLSGQLYWLKAEGPLVNDSPVQMISKCKLLKKLSLANSNITNASLKYLKSMELETLNLYNTRIAKSLPGTSD